MSSVNRSALMPYSASQMFAVVNDVENYADFLPWCGGTQILEQTETSMQARVKMRKGKLNHSFTTRNTLVKDRSIHMQLVDGPFKKLSGDWSFTPLKEQGCKIELRLDFEFSNPVVKMLIGPVFTQIANSMVDAFCQRAHQLYRKQ